MNADLFRKALRNLMIIGVTGLLLSASGRPGWANPPESLETPNGTGRIQSLTTETSDEASNILVELFLSNDQKENIDAIKKAFDVYAIHRVRAQFYRLGKSPKNIAIGREVPAPVARLALRLAQTYNGGIEFVMPQVHFFPEYITIGSSAFDEASNIPISPEELKRLSDPSLSTEQFHSLYRSITGEEPNNE